jgi:hypothetical protein
MIYFRMQPSAMPLQGHRSEASDESHPPGIDVFTSVYEVFNPDAGFGAYGNEVLVIEAPSSWPNHDVEGVRIDPRSARILRRYSLQQWRDVMRQSAKLPPGGQWIFGSKYRDKEGHIWELEAHDYEHFEAALSRALAKRSQPRQDPRTLMTYHPKKPTRRVRKARGRVTERSQAAKLRKADRALTRAVEIHSMSKEKKLGQKFHVRALHQVQRRAKTLGRAVDRWGQALRGGRNILIPDWLSSKQAAKEAKATQRRHARRDPMAGAARATLAEMTELLKRAGYERPGAWAQRFAAEGMGPHELEYRIRQGSLTYNYGIQRTAADPTRVRPKPKEPRAHLAAAIVGVEARLLRAMEKHKGVRGNIWDVPEIKKLKNLRDKLYTQLSIGSGRVFANQSDRKWHIHELRTKSIQKAKARTPRRDPSPPKVHAIDPAGEYAAHQRRMRSYIAVVSGGTREYVPNSALPTGKGTWKFWSRPKAGGKAREESVTHKTLMRARYES